jgi:hypothetical protein
MLALTPAKPAPHADFDGFAAVAPQPLSALPPHQVPALELRASRRGAARVTGTPANADACFLFCVLAHAPLFAPQAVTPAPEAVFKRAAVPSRRFVSPPAPHRRARAQLRAARALLPMRASFSNKQLRSKAALLTRPLTTHMRVCVLARRRRRHKLSPEEGAAQRAAAAAAHAHGGAGAQRVKGLRTGVKRPRELLLAPAGARDAAKRPRELPMGHLVAPPLSAASPSPLLAVDLSGLDLLLRASEATPLKSPLLLRGRVPGASPLGQLAHLVAGSPYVPQGWHAAARAGGVPGGAAGAGVSKVARKLAGKPGGALGRAGALEAARGSADGAVRAATAAVVDLAPGVAVAAAARWLDLLVADIRARHAALRKSRGRLARAHSALAEGRASSDAAAAAVLMRQLDGALAGEEAMLVARLQQVADMRTLCGAPDGQLHGAGKLSGATPAQAAASAAALVLTAATLASGQQQDAARAAGGSSGSEGDC